MHRSLSALTLALFCSLAQAAAPLNTGLLAVSLQKKPAGTFYVSGSIDGYGDLDLLVDTGSSLLVINEEILESLEAADRAEFSHDLGGSMADGRTRVVPVYRVSSLRIGEHCWVHDIDAAVLPSSTRAILGMNVLSRLSPFTFSAEPPQLMLNQCGKAAQPPAPALSAQETTTQTQLPATAASAVAGRQSALP